MLFGSFLAANLTENFLPTQKASRNCRRAFEVSSDFFQLDQKHLIQITPLSICSNAICFKNNPKSTRTFARKKLPFVCPCYQCPTVHTNSLQHHRHLQIPSRPWPQKTHHDRSSIRCSTFLASPVDRETWRSIIPVSGPFQKNAKARHSPNKHYCRIHFIQSNEKSQPLSITSCKR